jgi:hypothetical protein
LKKCGGLAHQPMFIGLGYAGRALGLNGPGHLRPVDVLALWARVGLGRPI